MNISFKRVILEAKIPDFWKILKNPTTAQKGPQNNIKKQNMYQYQIFQVLQIFFDV
jgi:hypothetical protein